jgi:Cu+-exporting ATPase
MAETIVRIDGMTCDNCVQLVRNSLTNVAGVLEAEVSLDDNRARVKYDTNATDLNVLYRAVEDAGYIAFNDTGTKDSTDVFDDTRINEPELSTAEKVTLPIEGMNCCTSCAQTIEKSIIKQKGVNSAVVNFAAEKAYVEYNPALIGILDLEEAVRAVGYDVRSDGQKVTLKLGGMSCTSCAQTIEKALTKTKGVKSVVVNFAAETAYVEFDTAVTGLEKLKAAVAATGYEVVDKDGEGCGRRGVSQHLSPYGWPLKCSLESCGRTGWYSILG